MLLLFVDQHFHSSIDGRKLKLTGLSFPQINCVAAGDGSSTTRVSPQHHIRHQQHAGPATALWERGVGCRWAPFYSAPQIFSPTGLLWGQRVAGAVVAPWCCCCRL